MSNFRDFLIESETSEEEKDIRQTLAKIPASHRALVKGYKFKFLSSPTLKHDKKSVGQIYQDTITIASPWHWSRSVILLHEVSHLVWEHKMTSEQKNEWKKLVKKTKIKKKDKQSIEELFAMSYGSMYSRHPPKTYLHPEWVEFIKKLK